MIEEALMQQILSLIEEISNGETARDKYYLHCELQDFLKLHIPNPLPEEKEEIIQKTWCAYGKKECNDIRFQGISVTENERRSLKRYFYHCPVNPTNEMIHQHLETLTPRRKYITTVPFRPLSRNKIL